MATLILKILVLAIFIPIIIWFLYLAIVGVDDRILEGEWNYERNKRRKNNEK